MQEKGTEPTRRVYAMPEIRIYGDVREITRNRGDEGGADGGTGERNKSRD